VTTPQGSDRLVLFTDAVVAIAVTLLVLPLVDVVPEVAREHGDAVEVITENQSAILSFLLSFVVIARLWMAHHRLFEHVRSYNRWLVWWNMLWLLSIVVLPFPTEMIGRFSGNQFTAVFYIGTILVSSVCLTVLTLIVRRTLGLAADSQDGPSLPGTVIATVLAALAFLLALLIPELRYYALLALLLAPAVEQLRRRRPGRNPVSDSFHEGQGTGT
jgi:uncharacterized membrane protein